VITVYANDWQYPLKLQGLFISIESELPEVWLNWWWADIRYWRSLSTYSLRVAGARLGGHVRAVAVIAVTSRVSRDTMPDLLLLVTVIFAVLHVTSGLTSICVGVVACSLSDAPRAHSVTPIWSGTCVSIVTCTGPYVNKWLPCFWVLHIYCSLTPLKHTCLV